MWGKGNRDALLVGLQIGAATMKNTTEFPQKIKNRTTLCASNSTSWCLSKEIENTNLKKHMNPYVHCSVTYNGQDMEAT